MRVGTGILPVLEAVGINLVLATDTVFILVSMDIFRPFGNGQFSIVLPGVA